MDSGPFYVTVISNKTEHFPDNKPSNFKNLLPVAIDFSSEEYEVALSSVIIPNQYSLFPSKSLYLIFVEKRPYPNRPNSFRRIQHQIFFNLDSVQSIDDKIVSGKDFLNNINETIRKYLTSKSIAARLIFRTDKSDKIKFAKEGTITKVIFSKGLRNVLGFKKIRENRLIANVTETATIPTDLYYYRHSAWIYSNVVAGQIVGSEVTPLLKVIALTDFRGRRQVHHIIDNPQYTKCRRAIFPHFEVNIKDEQGSDLHFFGGSVILTLHFRPCSKK